MLAIGSVPDECAPPLLTGTRKEGLQQFVRDPLLYISRWYNANMSAQAWASMEEPSAHAQSKDEEEQQTGGPVGFHENAESFRSSLRAGTASIMLQQRGEGGVHFVNLPVGVHLQIFSYLDVASLCRLSQTCGYLHNLTSDPLLWKGLLQRDLPQWPVVGHLSVPSVYQEASSDLTPKEIYANCYAKRSALPQQSFTHPFTGRLKSLVRRIQGHIPHVVMFGSGLESVPLVRNLLWEDVSPYRPVGLYPGKDGVGSGVCIQHRGSPVNLITLYSATRAERRAAAAGRQGRVNKLVRVSAQEGSKDQPELTQSVQEVCGAANAFILVVDPSRMDSDEVALNQTILSAMMRSGGQHTPLLVLSCHLDSPLHVLSPAQVAEQLNLCSLTHPWQVRSLEITTYEGIQDGFDWLLGASRCSN